jgi:small-conductance mechanosensitive channel
MDLQERRQLDVAARMARVRAKARPWRSIIALILAIAGAVAASFWGVSSIPAAAQKAEQAAGMPAYRLVNAVPGYQAQKLIWIFGLAAFFVFGLVAVIALATRARSGLQPLLGQAHAGVLRYVLLLAGVFAIVTVTLAILGVSPDRLVLGGAVTGVLIGIAAQQSLANLFAGLVLLFAHPFRVGDHVRFRAGALSGEIEGVITDLSLAYVRLETEQGRMLLPNAQALAAAVLLIPEPFGATAGQSLAGDAPTGSAGAGAAPSSADAPTGESAA